ncbi:MAG: tetratricopeptide repeat protein [Desulfomonilaceae bacterium]
MGEYFCRPTKCERVFVFALLILLEPINVTAENISSRVPPEVRLKIEKLPKAANRGDSAAAFKLGVMYSDGHETPHDGVEADKWFKKAADQGDAEAQSNLAWMYGNCQGVVKERSRSGKMVHKSG